MMMVAGPSTVTVTLSRYGFRLGEGPELTFIGIPLDANGRFEDDQHRGAANRALERARQMAGEWADATRHNTWATIRWIDADHRQLTCTI